jgi:hypothetical protein
MIDHLEPKENIQIYCYLFSIETVLRELTIEEFEAIDGPKWYKKRLPGGERSPLEKYRKGIETEKKTKWIQSVPHHPIYYIDFSHLKIVIERKDNWDNVFRHVFGPQKDTVCSGLSDLEFIRNKIAHNRKATSKEIDIVKGVYTKLFEAIGQKKFDELVSRCTCAMDIMERLTELQKESKRLLHACNNCESIEKLEVWESICCEWWFDESYLGDKIDSIINYFKIIKEYSKLPQTRGMGHKIELWVKSRDIETQYTKAQSEFSTILT